MNKNKLITIKRIVLIYKLFFKTKNCESEEKMKYKYEQINLFEIIPHKYYTYTHPHL